MTVTYAQKVASVNKIGSFRRVISIYRGSVYKLIKFDVILYSILYALIAISYRLLLPEHMKHYFESFVMYCRMNYGHIPLTFVLAFYMNNVVQRWWETWKSIPWPDSLALKLNILFPDHAGREEECMRIKRNIMRYVNLSITETFRMISSPVKKRFPTYQHLVDANLMTDTEMDAIEIAYKESEFMNTFYWLPLNWAGHLLMKVEQDGMLCRRYVADILDEINTIRGRNGDLLSYDWINVPIIYTQLVTIAVYSYFATSLFGRQTLYISEGQTILENKDIGGIFNIIPLYLMLEFLFYVGWLKVAEVLINPYGEDDDDFETNYLIDRNVQICYLYLDGVGQKSPNVGKDLLSNVGMPKELPYTIASLPFRKPHLETGAENLTVPIDQHQTIAPEDIKYFKKSSASRNVSMMLNTAMGFNNIVKLVANPVIERKQRVSDSQYIGSKEARLKISTISSPTVLQKSSHFIVEDEKRSSVKKCSSSSTNSFSFLQRTRKDGLSKDSPETCSSGETLKKLSTLLWKDESSAFKAIETSKDCSIHINNQNNPGDTVEPYTRKDKNDKLSRSVTALDTTSLQYDGQKKSNSKMEDLKLTANKTMIEVLHHGTVNTPTIRRVTVNEDDKEMTLDKE